MAITLTIAGVDRTPYLRRGPWSVEKRFANERFRAEIRDLVFASSAYAPVVGDPVRLLHGVDLVFGGRVTDVTRARLQDEGPIVTTFEARGWEALAEEVLVTATLASTTALAMGYALFLAYLQPRGCTWISATSGGPTVPELVIDHQPLAQVYTQIGKLSGRLFRINGDKQAGMVAPGELAAPATWTGAAVLQGFEFRKSRADRASRAYVRTGGSGSVTHSEGRTLNGTQTVFPLNVEPTTPPTLVTENGTPYTIGAGVWSYDAATNTLTRAGAGTAGHTFAVSYVVDFPAWVRCWHSSIALPSGALDESTAVDAVLQLTDVVDLAQAKALGDAELSRRVSEPWTAHGTTRTPGWYPLLRLPVSMAAEHGITSDFLVTAVTVTPDDINEGSTTQHVSYAVEAVEGDTPGRQWEDLFREALGAGSGGGIAIAGTSSVGGGGVASPGLAGTFQLHQDRDAGVMSASYVALGAGVFLNGDYIPAGATVRLRVALITDSASTSVTAKLRRVSGPAADVATTSASTSTNYTEQTVTFTPVSGWHAYELQVAGSDANARVNAIGGIDVLPA